MTVYLRLGKFATEPLKLYKPLISGYFMDSTFMESYYNTYNSENPEALKGFYHQDVELTSSQGVQRGVDSIMKTYSYLISVFHDKMTPDKISSSGNITEVIITDKFTAKEDIADFMGMSLTQGDTFTLHLRGVYEVVDGKFKSIRIEQLG
jgi:hypothetical protein